MQKTRIEWTDFSLNCFWGCWHNCSYCAARNMARRFGRSIAEKRGYPSFVGENMANFQPQYLEDQMLIGRVSPKFRSRNPNLKLGQAMIFCEEMGDIMGEWVPDSVIWTLIQQQILSHWQHVIQLLTKNPARYKEFNGHWPENVWLGTSISGTMPSGQQHDAIAVMGKVEAPVKFISFEPLLADITPQGLRLLLENAGIKWLIIGPRSPLRSKTNPYRWWVENLIYVADSAHIPVFLKDNLLKLYPDLPHRQEFPV